MLHFARIVQKLEAPQSSAVGIGVATRRQCRVIGKQGRHSVKAPILRELLFAWFCMVRGSIKGRLPLNILEAKAEGLRLACIEAAVVRGERAVVPLIIGRNWLWRFRKTYNISLRRPNKRWKVPRKVLLSRLRCMWQNTLRIRCLAWLTFDYDLDADGFDQKPFHINEAGSKCART